MRPAEASLTKAELRDLSERPALRGQRVTGHGGQEGQECVRPIHGAAQRPWGCGRVSQAEGAEEGTRAGSYRAPLASGRLHFTLK